MSDNPYQPPQADLQVVGVKSGHRDDLRSVAIYQKAILVCILVYLVAVVCRFFLPLELRPILQIGIMITGIVGTVFVFLLAMKVYRWWIGVLLGILALIPCLGLIVLLVVNGQATSILKRNGIKVGLLGAKLSDISVQS